MSNIHDKINKLKEKKKNKIKKENDEDINDDINIQNKKNIKLDNISNNEFEVGPAEKKTKLVVEFLFNPEYISVGQKIIINDQNLKAYGVITKIFK